MKKEIEEIENQPSDIVLNQDVESKKSTSTNRAYKLREDLHPKLRETIDTFLIDLRNGLPFYGYYNLMINFYEQKIGTCGVNMTAKGMNFYYDNDFLDNLTQLMVNFVVIHEDFHLLFNHPKRTISGRFNHKIANIAQDMIINQAIWEDINHKFIEIPKYPATEKNIAAKLDGKNMGIFVPKEYDGELIFEILYMWLKEKKEEYEKNKSKKGHQNLCSTCKGSGKVDKDQLKSPSNDGEEGEGKGKPNQQGQGQQDQQQGQGQQGQGQQDQQQQNSDADGDGDGGDSQCDCPDCKGSGLDNSLDSTGKPAYGAYGKGGVETFSLESLLENMDNNDGMFMDVHIPDEIPEELREAMSKDAIERLRSRGLTNDNIEKTLNKLRKKRKDYLKEIKRSISNDIMGTTKNKTITRPNRRGISGLKGSKKYKARINVVLDTSGSMSGLVDKVLSYIFRHDIVCNLVQIDARVQAVQEIKSMKDLAQMKLKGFGGTVLQPAVDLLTKKFNQYNTVVLTDGYTDQLDFSKHNGKVLIVTAGTECPISRKPKKGLKQIIVKENE